MTQVLLLGAGNIGQAIAHLLSASGDYEVTVADRDERALAGMPEAAKRATVDATDANAVRRALTGFDVVVNACPHYLNVPIARAARDAGVHYFDLTEDVSTARTIRELAEGADTLFAPQCGLAPGFVSIAAFDLAQHFDTMQWVRLRVGALPLFPANALKYNLTWSTAGLINEYCNPCQVIHDGDLREVLPLEGLEQFSHDGVTYEAFNTSGGLGTLSESLLGRVDHLSYKTIRYPGHCELIKFLCDDLRLCKRRELFKDVLENALPVTAQDVVLIFVAVSGTRRGRLIQETFTKKVYHGEVQGRPLSAIQITTASGLCAIVDMHRAGKLPRQGFLRMEQVRLADFLDNRFGRHYGA
jgi:saccharopine dehydrogenase-like NADP-dependent oxidoreductase